MWWSKTYKNVVGVSKERLELLLKLFEGLRAHDQQLHDRSLRYILDGDEESVLADIGASEQVAAKLQLKCRIDSGVNSSQSWATFFDDVEAIDCRFYLRLAKVFEAAARRLPVGQFVCQALLEHTLWLAVLLQEATGTYAHHYSFHYERTALSGALVDALLQADERDIHPFLTIPFQVRKNNWDDMKARGVVLALADIGQTFAAHRDLIAPFLLEGSADSRRSAVEIIAQAKVDPQVFLAELIEAAVDSSKLLREAAEALLRSIPQQAQPLLEAIASQSDRTRKEPAIRLLGRICWPASRPFLTRLRGTEKSKPVQETLDAILQNVAVDLATPADWTLPPRTPIDQHPPVTAGLRAALERLVTDYNAHATKTNSQIAQRNLSQPSAYRWEPLAHLDLAVVGHLVEVLEQGGQQPAEFGSTLGQGAFFGGQPTGAYKALFEHPDCHLTHMLRLIDLIGYICRDTNPGRTVFGWGAPAAIETYRRNHEPRITLLDLAEGLRSLGSADDALRDQILGSWQSQFDWEAHAVWPFFYDHLPRLEQALDPVLTHDWQQKWTAQRARNSAFRILAKFPHVPPAMVSKIWELALGSNKADRQQAIKVAEKLPDLSARLPQALTSGNFQVRAAAAERMGQRDDPAAIEPLLQAARKEKQDFALDTMLTALERLGASIDEFLDHRVLAANAAKGLKKGLPEALAWFPWLALPAVHWQDTGERVSVEIVHWLIVQSYKLKTPEAGPLLRRYCAMMVSSEREALGNFVLAAWLQQDLKPKHTDASARVLARQQIAKWYPQGPPQQGLEDQVYQSLMGARESAIDEKGLLAVAAACCSDEAVAPVVRYLKEWYGQRAAQCKAMIGMLSCIDRPAALQYLLSISNRFRTKGIREEAERYVSLLAERKGWTLDELADRTMPTAGFDDSGALELSFGPRTFIARVNAGLDIVLHDPDGKVLKNLPAPRKDDDETQARLAKKSLSAARAALKKFSSLQTTRLYEAMCTERTWAAQDWQTYLAGHPLMRFLCQRIVWAIFEGDKPTQVFRLLDDGTLTDADDAAVTLPESATIRVAHASKLPAEAAIRWKQHLVDYDVSPLFTQLGRDSYELPASKRNDMAVSDFEGYMVEAFKLRSLATKFGYTRGQPQDGGWFYDYSKQFPGLGLHVRLNFSGNGLPEENRSVALTTLSFQKVEPGASYEMPLALREVPGVLLTECLNDLRAIAATGKGFNPEWEKSVY